MATEKKNTTKKRKSRREKLKYPELDPKYSLKTRADLLDQDYLHKLSPEELEWFNKFNKEYISGDLNREDLSSNLHNTKKLKKDCDDRNNARNRDILTRVKASNQVVELDVLTDEGNWNEEDDLIDKLDRDKAREILGWLAEKSDSELEALEKIIVKDLK